MRYKLRSRNTLGAAPGSVIYTGRKRDHKISFTLFEYDSQALKHRDINSLDEVDVRSDSIKWLDISGIHNESTIRDVCNYFKVHPLVQEDIANVNQRAKAETHTDLLFAVMKMIQYQNHKVMFEQVSFILKNNLLITFQEEPGDVFDPVRKRLKEQSGRITSLGADYLFYALMDTIVDNYYDVLEQLGDVLEDLDEGLMHKPSPQTLERIRRLKREVVFLRKSVWPVREIVNVMQHHGQDFIQDTTQMYVRDLYDHVVQVIDLVETFKDLASGMLDTYNSSVANRMNEIMKVLTIISTIFIPLTFLAGVYGMNFDNIPELSWSWAYFAVLGIMAVIALFMIRYFKRLGWI